MFQFVHNIRPFEPNIDHFNFLFPRKNSNRVLILESRPNSHMGIFIFQTCLQEFACGICVKTHFVPNIHRCCRTLLKLEPIKVFRSWIYTVLNKRKQIFQYLYASRFWSPWQRWCCGELWFALAIKRQKGELHIIKILQRLKMSLKNFYFGH